MSLEPLDRKSSFRERKRCHESSESFGSVARWRGSSNYNRSREFYRGGGGGDYRRLGGHRKQGSWQLFPEESGHRHTFSRTFDKRLEDDNYRPSFSRGDGNYGRGNKESRGTFNQRQWRGRSSETVNNSLNMSRRQTNASNDRKSVDDMLTYSSHSNSDLVNTWEQHNMKDQHDKMGGVNRFVIGQRCDRDSSLGTIDWKPLKWTRPGCSSSRDSGFSRSSGMRNFRGTNSKGSREWKDGLQEKIATAVESNSGEAAACRAPSDEENLRKKPRLNWGEGLAKFERKHVEGPEVTSNNDDPVSPPFNMEPNNFLSTSLVDKSPKVSGLSGCASPATPTSAARSSSPGGESGDDKLFGKAANLDHDVGNLSSSPDPGSQSHLQMFSFNLEKVDIDSLISLGSSLVELLPQSDNMSSVDCSLLFSTSMNKLLILKADISKVLEVTETEIDSLENELRSFKSDESKNSFQCTEAVGSLLTPCTYRHVANVPTCGDSNSSLEVKDAKSSLSFCSSTGDILYDTIISCNEKTAKAACEVFDKLLPATCCQNENIGASSGSGSHNGTLIKGKFAERRRLARLKEKIITLKFKSLHHLWKEDMRILSIRKHRPKSHKKLESELRTTSNNHQKKRSSIPFRFPFPGNQLKLVPTSEMIKYTSQLLSESKHEIHRSTLKMPALILDQKDKMYSLFLSSNGLVEDPVAIEKERAMINPWTSEEKEIFLEKFAAFGKDFRKIATFLDHKTTADCVEFYYKNHKSECFEKIKKKDDDKLGNFFKAKTDLMTSSIKCNSEVNASSLDILSAASVMADDIARNQKMRSGSSLWRGYSNKAMSRCDNIITERPDNIITDERETVAADVLASICGCLLSEATSSSITSSVYPVKGKRVKKCVKLKPLSKKPPTPDITQNIDNDTCSDESCSEMELTDWSDVEKSAFLHAVSLFGKDFAMISQRVRSRSPYQCKVFFSKTQKRLRLNLMGDRPENVGSLVNDDVDGGRSDADNACVVETGSANGSDSSGTKTGVDQPASDKKLYYDESNPVEASNPSADLYVSEEISRKVDHDVNMVSNACVIGGQSKLDTDGNLGVFNGSDRSASVLEQRAIAMSDSIEIGKGERSEGGGAVTEIMSGMGTMEQCCSNSVAEGRLVSDRDEADTDVGIELKDNVHDSSTLVNTSLSAVDVSCPRSSVEAENEPQLCLEKPQFSGSSEGPLTNANSTSQNTDGAAVQYKKTSIQDLPSCDFQGNQDTTGHNSSSSLGHQLCNPGNSPDHVEAASILQCCNLQVPSEKEVNVNMSCSSSATELPLLPQKNGHEHYKSLPCLPDLEEPPRNDVKIFGKILTVPSSTLMPNLCAKRNKENGTHHPKLSSASSSLKSTGHDNTGVKSAILNVDLNDRGVFENVPAIGYSDGNKLQPVFSSLPDSAILLAKYPAAFGSYPGNGMKKDDPLG